MADTQAFEYQTVSITSGNMLPQPKEKNEEGNVKDQNSHMPQGNARSPTHLYFMLGTQEYCSNILRAQRNQRIQRVSRRGEILRQENLENENARVHSHC